MRPTPNLSYPLCMKKLILFFGLLLPLGASAQDFTRLNLLGVIKNGGDPEIIANWCVNGEEVGTADYGKGRNALHMALTFNNHEASEVLIHRCGFEAGLADGRDKSPIYLARKNPETVKLLLKNGADPNHVRHKLDGSGGIWQSVPLIYELALNDVPRETLVLVLEAGANPHVKNSDGVTPMQAAEMMERQSNIEVLASFSHVGQDSEN